VADTVSEHGSDDPNRRDFIYIAAGAAAAGAAGMLVWPLIDQMNPAGDTLALASIEFDLSKVTEGQQVVIKWRGKPVFVRYRTAKEIAEAVAADNLSMPDPAKDADRHLKDKPQWLILVGVCTHLVACRTWAAANTAAGSAPAMDRSTIRPAVSVKARRRAIWTSLRACWRSAIPRSRSGRAKKHERTFDLQPQNRHREVAGCAPADHPAGL
jgi:ubiquinol-cytochrome c reductase iron-sulfur subunit